MFTRNKRALASLAAISSVGLVPSTALAQAVGSAANTFDMQAALEQWVEHGTVPERIIATRALNGIVDRTRPLCPYPQLASYKGSGDTNDAASFVCKAP